MKLETKYNINDVLWFGYKKKPTSAIVRGVKVVVVKTNIIKEDGNTDTVLSFKNRYLIGTRWISESALYRSEKEFILNNI